MDVRDIHSKCSLKASFMRIKLYQLLLMFQEYDNKYNRLFNKTFNYSLKRDNYLCNLVEAWYQDQIMSEEEIRARLDRTIMIIFIITKDEAYPDWKSLCQFKNFDEILSNKPFLLIIPRCLEESNSTRKYIEGLKNFVEIFFKKSLAYETCFYEPEEIDIDNHVALSNIFGKKLEKRIISILKNLIIELSGTKNLVNGNRRRGLKRQTKKFFITS